MSQPQAKDREAELDILTRSVNPERLRNNPVKLDEEMIHTIFDRILK